MYRFNAEQALRFSDTNLGILRSAITSLHIFLAHDNHLNSHSPLYLDAAAETLWIILVVPQIELPEVRATRVFDSQIPASLLVVVLRILQSKFCTGV